MVGFVVLGWLRIFDLEDFNCFAASMWVVVHEKINLNTPHWKNVTIWDHRRDLEASAGSVITSHMWVIQLEGQEIDLNHMSFGKVLVRRKWHHVNIDKSRTGMLYMYCACPCIGPIGPARIVARTENAITAVLLWILPRAAKINPFGMHYEPCRCYRGSMKAKFAMDSIEALINNSPTQQLPE